MGTKSESDRAELGRGVELSYSKTLKVASKHHLITAVQGPLHGVFKTILSLPRAVCPAYAPTMTYFHRVPAQDGVVWAGM